MKKEYYLYAFLVVIAVIFGYYEYKNYENNSSGESTNETSNVETPIMNNSNYGYAATNNISIPVPSNSIGINASLKSFAEDLAASANHNFSNEYLNNSSFTSSNPILASTNNTINQISIPENSNNVTANLNTVTNPAQSVVPLNLSYTNTITPLTNGNTIVSNQNLKPITISQSTMAYFGNLQKQEINEAVTGGIAKQYAAHPNPVWYFNGDEMSEGEY